jgi:predicted SnoaL-like aldol condensation-catalyzing enzyme
VSTTSAESVVRRYVDELYHRRNSAAVAELVADPQIRHEPSGETHTLTLADSLARAAKLQTEFSGMRFDTIVFIANETDVCLVFDAVLTKADGTDVKMCSAEIFRVKDGKITEVWNPALTVGSLWG